MENTPQQSQYQFSKCRIPWWCGLIAFVAGIGIGFVVGSQMEETTPIEEPIAIVEEKPKEAKPTPPPPVIEETPHEKVETAAKSAVELAHETIDEAYNSLTARLQQGEIRYREMGDAYNSITYFETRSALTLQGEELKEAQQALFLRYKAEMTRLHELPSFEEQHRRGKLTQEEYNHLIGEQAQLNEKVAALTKK